MLFLSHPKKKIRDTQKCKIFRQKHPSIGSLASLKNLAKLLLGITVQEGEHNSVHDAQTAMMLYLRFRKEWEAYLRTKRLETKETKADKETVSLIKDGSFASASVDIKSGNETHKRYLQNKLKKRHKFTKKFIK